MGNRRKAREYALKILYQLDITEVKGDVATKDFWELHSCITEIKEFTEKIVKGTIENKTQIDNLLKKYSQNWGMERMGIIDRNILRLGVFELIHLADIPSNVTINEAVEIAKKFGMNDSPQFVNGILDRIKNDLKNNTDEIEKSEF